MRGPDRLLRSIIAGTCACAGAVLIGSSALAQSASPIDLSGALAQVRGQTPIGAAAEAGVSAAHGRVRQAGALPNPEASVQAEGFSGTGPYRGLNQAETTFALSQRLELGGKRQARVGAARAELTVAELRLALQRADLELAARERFAEAYAAKDKVSLAQAAVDRAQDLSRVANIMVEAGREPPLRASRARAALSEAEAALIAARTDYESTKRALAAVWGATSPPSDVVGPWELPSAPGDLAPDPTQSLDLKLAEAESGAARAVVRRERSLATPDVAVQAGLKRYDTGDRALVAGISAPLPLFDRNRGAVAAAHADALAAENRQRQELAEAVRRARDASAALTASGARLAALQSTAVPQAQEALRLARLGYEAGKFSLLDVLDAEAAFADAQASLVEARLAHAKAAAALARAAAQ